MRHKVLSGLAKDEVLRTQAALSIEKKSFHALGGSVYSLYPETRRESAVRFITAFQTISDYLDNLCDRANVFDEDGFKTLHKSMSDPFDESAETDDYYALYPYKNDGGYLKRLSNECRHEIKKLPSSGAVIPYIKFFVSLYSELQSYKHIHPDKREERLLGWASPYSKALSDISAYEFSAAAGSTLGVFVLFAAACSKKLSKEEARNIAEAYFPYVTGLHILLDYYIDAKEDKKEKDLNFTSYYNDLKECENRLSFFIRKSFEKVSSLKYPSFHKTVIQGLLALYLSDKKALTPELKKVSMRLLRKGGRQAVFYHRVLFFLRLFRKI